jgi:galactose mutarotase-like enzyme
VFAIALQESQYKTYILSDQAANSQLEVVPERGGIITKWRVQGQEILYLDAERFANPELSVRGGIPILFPICGNLPDNTYTYNGQQYTLKQHGFARDFPWEVADQVTQEAASLTLVLNSNEQTRAVYPFDFQLAFTYQILGNSLEIQQNSPIIHLNRCPFLQGCILTLGYQIKLGYSLIFLLLNFKIRKLRQLIISVAALTLTAMRLMRHFVI